MPRERVQPLLVEIPLALRQPHDITPPGESPLMKDADVALSLQFYFLKARIPLAAAQVQHLTSLERLLACSGLDESHCWCADLLPSPPLKHQVRTQDMQREVWNCSPSSVLKVSVMAGMLEGVAMLKCLSQTQVKTTQDMQREV